MLVILLVSIKLVLGGYDNFIFFRATIGTPVFFSIYVTGQIMIGQIDREIYQTNKTILSIFVNGITYGASNSDISC